MPPEARGSSGLLAVILAAQRAGVVDPLAERAGVTHKCLVPIADKALIAHVAAALQATPPVERIRIVVEPEAASTIRRELPPGPAPVEFIEAASNLADSVYAATRDVDMPTIVTTADNVLLTPAAVASVHAALLRGAGAVLAMSTRAAVLGAHPEGQRRFYRFRDDHYSNCNLYGFSGARTLRGAELFRGGGQFAKKPMRLVAAVGPLNVLLFLLGWLSLAGAMRRLSRRLGLHVEAVVLKDGAHAVDVDNERTYRVASLLLERRDTGESACALLETCGGLPQPATPRRWGRASQVPPSSPGCPQAPPCSAIFDGTEVPSSTRGAHP